ncbi:MAG: helix-turn-helix domain-containing protein, partial [Firmicutes bacterium]|nr:helix-turn-helix domain-containing protein [Bacillota bacterium]
MNAILGARIRSLRLAKGLTQEEIAEQLNCSRQKYARIEKG